MSVTNRVGSYNSRREVEESRIRRSYQGEVARLRRCYLNGASALDITNNYCSLIDSSLQPLLEWGQLDVKKGTVKESKASWLALGQYGSLELAPFSCGQLLLVTHSSGNSSATEVVEKVHSKIAKVGIQAEINNLTVKECLRRAQVDMDFCLSLLSARRLSGAKSVGHDCLSRLRSDLVKNPLVYFCDLESHYREKGGNLYSLTSDLISGRGGLWTCTAFLQTLSLFSGGRDPVKILRKGGITVREWSQLVANRERLLQIQIYLQLLEQKSEINVLSDNGRMAAEFLGYRQARHQSSLEQLIRDLLRLKRKLTKLFEHYLNQSKATFSGGSEPFKSHYSQIALQPKWEPQEETPERWMKIFQLSRVQPQLVEDQLKDMISLNTVRWTRGSWNSRSIHDDFRVILGKKGKVGTMLRIMRDVGFLARYLPEFGRLDCIACLDRGHGYSVDEHTLRTIDQLDQISSVTDPSLQDYKELLLQVQDPSVLYVALLLHESGSGLSNELVRNSQRLAGRALQRINFNSEDREKVMLLIREQFLLAHVSQHRDFDDPKIIQEIIDIVETADNLNMLLLHTFADLSSMEENSWSERNWFLLWSLYFKVMDLFIFGDPVSTAEHARVAEIHRLIIEENAEELSVDAILEHFSLLPEKYALYSSADQIVSHIRLCEKLKRLVLVSEWVAKTDADYFELHLSTHDVPGRFAQIMGVLTALGIRVLSAQLNTREDGIVIDTFHVCELQGQILSEEKGRQKVEQALVEVILGRSELMDLIPDHQAQKPCADQARPSLVITPRVRIDNDISAQSTVVEVQAPNHWSLSYRIAATLARFDLNILSAKLATEKEYAFDVFYVQTKEGKKVINSSQMTQIIEQIRFETK